MVSASQLLVADERADVIDIDAAELSALVAPATSLLVAPPVAPRIVCPTGQRRAIQLGLHPPTTTLNLNTMERKAVLVSSPCKGKQ